jgi:hypothetical protein
MRLLFIAASVMALCALLYAGGQFIDDGNGTVRDVRTGLVWQKCSAGLRSPECSGEFEQMKWDDAMQYCAALSLAGKKWRLPGIDELKTIVDVSRHEPAIDSEAFPNTKASNYWSSSHLVSNTSFACHILFLNGDVYYNADTLDNYVRCVADGP